MSTLPALSIGFILGIARFGFVVGIYDPAFPYLVLLPALVEILLEIPLRLFAIRFHSYVPLSLLLLGSIVTLISFPLGMTLFLAGGILAETQYSAVSRRKGWLSFSLAQGAGGITSVLSPNLALFTSVVLSPSILYFSSSPGRCYYTGKNPLNISILRGSASGIITSLFLLTFVEYPQYFFVGSVISGILTPLAVYIVPLLATFSHNKILLLVSGLSILSVIFSLFPVCYPLLLLVYSVWGMLSFALKIFTLPASDVPLQYVFSSGSKGIFILFFVTLTLFAN